MPSGQSRRREPDRPGKQMWLRGPGGCGQRHGEGGRCPRPPRPGGRQDCRCEGGHGRRRGCVQGTAGGRAGARRGPARSPVPGRAITCARAGCRRPRGQARRRVARAAEGDAAARAHTVVVAARMAQGRAFARHLPPDRAEPAEQQARLQTPPADAAQTATGRRSRTASPGRRPGAAGRSRPAFGKRSRRARLIALHGREPPVLPVYALRPFGMRFPCWRRRLAAAR